MVWLFYCLIISKGYQGVLRSFMIVPVLTKPINQGPDSIDNIYLELQCSFRSGSSNKYST